MFAVKDTAGNELKISFSHDPVGMSTSCILEYYGFRLHVYTRVHPNDAYQRDLGRKEALRKMLKDFCTIDIANQFNVYTARALRRLLWDAYFRKQDNDRLISQIQRDSLK